MKVLNPPLKLTTEIVCFLFECDKRHKNCTEKEILNFFKKTPSYIKSGLQFLSENGLTENNNHIKLSSKILIELDGGNQKSENLIKNTLANNKPFVEYAYFLGKGKTELESAKLVKTIYEINRSETTLIKIFNDWVEYLDVDVKPKFEDIKKVKEFQEALRNKLNANKFLKEEFGEYYSMISETVLTDLSLAMESIKNDPSNALNDSGRALEDFLRLDIAKNVNLEKCTGIVQITCELNKYKEFPTKLNNISAALGNIRSMGKAHGADKELKERWKIKEQSAFAYLLLIVSLMVSYLEHKNKKVLIF